MDKVYSVLKKILEGRQKTALYGLAFVPLLAGISKFLHPELWMGYEPGFVRAVIGLSSNQIISFAGTVEILLGVWIATRRYSYYSATVAFVWLAAITVRVSTLGLWDIAIRDLGLTFYALSVALNEWSRARE